MDGARSGAPQADRRIYGREAELLMLRGFFESSPSATCLVLSGQPGIGKTTLWQAGLKAAETNGYRVLSARGSQAEVGLPFAALADLVDGVGPDVLATLPTPQLQALEVALRRRD